MSILYDDAQQAIGGEAVRILADRTRSETLKALLETTGRYDMRFWETCKEQGWTAVGIPEVFGGIGLGLVELGLIAEAIGQVAGGAPFDLRGRFRWLLLYCASRGARASACLCEGPQAAP